jgi:hypothetical protein
VWYRIAKFYNKLFTPNKDDQMDYSRKAIEYCKDKVINLLIVFDGLAAIIHLVIFVGSEQLVVEFCNSVPHKQCSLNYILGEPSGIKIANFLISNIFN